VADGASSSWRAALRGNVLALGIVSFFTDLSSEMIYPLLPAFITGLAPVGTAAVWVGLMEGTAETAASLLKLVSGRVSDALGRRKALVVLGYGLSTVCRPLMSIAAAAWHVVGLRFADRVGKGIRTSPRDAIVGDSVDPGHRGLAFSFHRAMDHAGAVLGPVAASAILWGFLGRAAWGSAAGVAPGEMRALRWVFALALVPGLFALGSLLLGVREVAKDRADPARPPGSWRDLPPRLYGFVAVTTLFALGNSSDLFLLLHGQIRFGLGTGSAIALWVALHLSKIAFSLPGGILSDRLGRRGVIVAGWTAYALVYLGMAAATTVGEYCALFVAYGLYYGMTEGAEKALVADLVRSERRGTAYGIYHGAIGLAALPASVLFGWIWSAAGPATAFGFGAALAGLATILLPFVPRGER
jgi:MFS family permease